MKKEVKPPKLLHFEAFAETNGADVPGVVKEGWCPPREGPRYVGHTGKTKHAEDVRFAEMKNNTARFQCPSFLKSKLTSSTAS